MDGFKQVQLLVSKKDIENFKIIRENLDSLKLLVEEAELWVQKMPRAPENKPQAQRVRGYQSCGPVCSACYTAMYRTYIYKVFLTRGVNIMTWWPFICYYNA